MAGKKKRRTNQYASDPIRAAMKKYQREALVLARRVMKEASQPYGGGLASGSEIVVMHGLLTKDDIVALLADCGCGDSI